jgi:phosphatidylinositol dimannoside acyltransferase
LNFQQFVTTEFGTKLWVGLGRLPLPAGRALARVVTGILWRLRGGSLYRILYGNQAVVLGPAATPQKIHRAVGAVLRHAGMTAIDLMYIASRGDEAIRSAVEFGPEVWENYHAATTSGRGVLVCGCHLSNFNLGFLAFGLLGIPVRVLSMAGPTGGFQVMQDFRLRGPIEQSAIDGASLRAAITHLRRGGVVGTGVDWPLGGSAAERLPFFGKPANLPTGHIRLAMSSGAVLLPTAFRWSAERGYYGQTAPHIALELTGDREADLRHNALRVLAVIEKWIAEAPDQWLMYHRMWPEDDGG